MIGNTFSLPPFLDPLCCMALYVHSTLTHVNLIYEPVSSTSHGKYLRRGFGGSLLHSSQRAVSWSLEVCRGPDSQARERPLIYTQISILTRSEAKKVLHFSTTPFKERPFPPGLKFFHGVSAHSALIFTPCWRFCP